MFEIRRYTSNMADAWNDFVTHSRQGTFLLDRRYMDYHSDRFKDYSLAVCNKGKLYALLPANADGTTIWSHQGLTYGGLITNDKATATDVCEVFTLINGFLKENGFRKVIYKAIPWIYHRLPAEEDLYALINTCRANLLSRDISSTIMMENRLRFRESRKSGIRKAIRNGIQVRESDDIAAFWTILNNNLSHKYGTAPVHTVEELILLKSRFPHEIRLFMAYKEDKPLGGSLIFETPQTVHTQYISASTEGKAEGALDLLFDYIINKVYADGRFLYFDFGKSTVDRGQTLNIPLIFQKEGFGGRGVCYDWYEYNL